MSDDTYSAAPLPKTPAASAMAAVPARRGGGTVLLGLVVAFLLGASGVAYAAWQGLIPLPQPPGLKLAAPANRANAPAAAVTAPQAAAAAAAAADKATLDAQQAQLEARVAALSARLDALTVAAQAAAGNAGRSEALLVAFAARRALDRGAQLGPLEDQLRMRFGDSQPNAVAKVIETARRPVTLDQLVAGLDRLAPELTQAPAQTSLWARLRGELGSLFVIRREAAPSPAPTVMLGHARIMLESGQIGDAIDEVARLPGASGAGDWFTAAHRYDEARRALDVLESVAMLDRPAGPARNALAPARAASAPTT